MAKPNKKRFINKIISRKTNRFANTHKRATETDWVWWHNLSNWWQFVFIQNINNSHLDEIHFEQYSTHNEQICPMPSETNLQLSHHKLKKIIKLKKFSARAAHLDDLTPLAKLSELSTLKLWCNSIQDLSPLATLSKLTSLDLCCNQIQDLSPLSTLSKLNRLELLGNPIQNLSPLAHLNQLTTLYLSNYFIQDLSPLSELTQLKNLYFSDDYAVSKEQSQQLKEQIAYLQIQLPHTKIQYYSRDDDIPF